MGSLGTTKGLGPWSHLLIVAKIHFYTYIRKYSSPNLMDFTNTSHIRLRQKKKKTPVWWSLTENTLWSLGFKRESSIWIWERSSFFRHRSALKEIIHDSGDTWNRASNRVDECKNLDSGVELSSSCCSGDCRLHLMESSWGLNVRRLPIIHEWIQWCNSNEQFFYIGQYEDRGLCNLPLTLSSTIYSLHYNIIKDEKAFISFKGFIFTFFFL